MSTKTNRFIVQNQHAVNIGLILLAMFLAFFGLRAFRAR